MRFELSTSDGVPRPEVFLFDGGHRDELLTKLKEAVADVDWNGHEVAETLNRFSESHPKARFGSFCVEGEEDGKIVLGCRWKSGAGRDISVIVHRG